MKILMVCLGNICRSPLAEGILRHKLNEKGIKGVEIDSAGTSGYHAGECPDERALKNAKKHGLDISALKARQFCVADFDRFDKIFTMDISNYNDIISLARNENDIKKVELILNTLHPKSNMPVPDPYFGGEEGFENVYKLLDNACEIIAEDLKKSSHV